MDLATVTAELEALPDGVHRSADRWQICAGRDRWQVEIAPGLVAERRPEWAALGRRQFLVVDGGVWALFGNAIGSYLDSCGVEFAVGVIPRGERAKSLRVVEALGKEAYKFGLAKRELVVGVGGGAAGDVARTFAALWRRGTPCACISTTPLAAVDGHVGLKHFINSGGAKNAFGGFAPAVVTLVDPVLFTSVPPAHRVSAVAEVVKVFLVAPDRDPLVRLLHENVTPLRAWSWDHQGVRQILRHAIDGMVTELQSNPREKDPRRRVDFGHAIGKVVELAARMPHGMSVSIDMAVMLVLAAQLDLLSWEFVRETLALMRRYALPIWHPTLTEQNFSRMVGEVAAQRGGLYLPIPTQPVTWLESVTISQLEAAASYLEPLKRARRIC